MVWQVSVLERRGGKNVEDGDGGLCGLISVAPRLDLKRDAHLSKSCMRLEQIRTSEAGKSISVEL